MSLMRMGNDFIRIMHVLKKTFHALSQSLFLLPSFASAFDHCVVGYACKLKLNALLLKIVLEHRGNILNFMDDETAKLSECASVEKMLMLLMRGRKSTE